MYSKSLRELPAMTYVTSKYQQTGKFSYLLIFRQFQRHILKNRTMLFPATFISTSEKIGVGLGKQASLTLMGTRKPTVRCLITRPDYPLWEHWSLSECRAFNNMQILDQNSFKIFHLHINNQTPWKVLQMRQHVSTGFWYATFAYIWSSQLRKIIYISFILLP